jgi:hypothetical protein
VYNVPENSLRWRWRRRRRSLTQIQIPITMISASGLIGRVLIYSHDPPVHPNRVPVDRGGRVVVVVLDLDLHAPEPLPVSPPQHEI